jgi:phosphatidylglycerol lysyltransferase
MAGKNLTNLSSKLTTSVWSLRFAAFLTLLMGVTNLLSSLTPAFRDRLLKLRELLPLGISNGSRLATALAGFALILLAFQLFRRKQIAWYFTEGFLLLTALAHIFKGLDFEETLFALLLALWLYIIRFQFHARSDAYSIRQGLIALGAATVFTLLYGTVGFALFAHHFRTHFNLWQALQQTLVMFISFVNPGLTPASNFGRYFIDSIYLIAIVTFAFAIYMLIRPVLVRQPASPVDREIARQAIHAHGKTILAPFALLPDKAYAFSKKGSVIDYVVQGRIALALGDPIGPNKDLSKAIHDYKNLCGQNDWLPAFVDVPPAHLSNFAKQGFHSLAIGHEAIVNLETFTLEGSRNKELRYAFNKFTKLGYSTEVMATKIPAKIKSDLREISDDWLTTHKGVEKRFWVGWFDEAYLDCWPLMIARDQSGRPIAFSNILSAYNEPVATVDMMRHSPETESGVMEYLFISMFLWAKESGFKQFDLGLCALAGVGTAPQDAAGERAIHYLYEHMKSFFDFQGLHHFKEKFHPDWQPRYLVFPSYSDLPGIIWALTHADSNKMPITGEFIR